MSNSRYQSLFSYGMAKGRRQEFPVDQAQQNAPVQAKSQPRKSLWRRISETLFKD